MHIHYGPYGKTLLQDERRPSRTETSHVLQQSYFDKGVVVLKEILHINRISFLAFSLDKQNFRKVASVEAQSNLKQQPIAAL